MKREKTMELYRAYVERHSFTPLLQVPLKELRERTETVGRKPQEEDSCSRATTTKSPARPAALSGTAHKIKTKKMEGIARHWQVRVMVSR